MTEVRVDNKKSLEYQKFSVTSIRKAPKTFPKTIQFNNSNTNAYCEKTVRNKQKMIADSDSGSELVLPSKKNISLERLLKPVR